MLFFSETRQNPLEKGNSLSPNYIGQFHVLGSKRCKADRNKFTVDPVA